MEFQGFLTKKMNRKKWNGLGMLNGYCNNLAKVNYKKLCYQESLKLEFDRNLNPFALLKKIKGSSANCYHFCFQVKKDLAFIGASPERLFKRDHNHLYLEAIAGTRNRGNSPDEDRSLGINLIQSEKDLREHQFVVDDLKRTAANLGCSVNLNPKVSLLKLNQLQHLYLKIEGGLPKDITDADILNSIHPTSAVGGTPQKAALKEIELVESFERGWYAGPVGWLGVNESEFSVGIRSGIIQDNRMENLYWRWNN